MLRLDAWDELAHRESRVLYSPSRVSSAVKRRSDASSDLHPETCNCRGRRGESVAEAARPYGEARARRRRASRKVAARTPVRPVALAHHAATCQVSV
eukprot:scaffold227966_cov33-Tisochrysis_lutea.AAC.4